MLWIVRKHPRLKLPRSRLIRLSRRLILAAGVVRLVELKSSGQSVLPEKSVVDFVPDQSGGAVETDPTENDR
jgi:hypothetical protein